MELDCAAELCSFTFIARERSYVTIPPNPGWEILIKRIKYCQSKLHRTSVVLNGVTQSGQNFCRDGEREPKREFEQFVTVQVVKQVQGEKKVSACLPLCYFQSRVSACILPWYCMDVHSSRRTRCCYPCFFTAQRWLKSLPPC